MRLGVLFGGRSAEHEVSLQSAKSIIENLSFDKYDIFPIGIDRNGKWHAFRQGPFLSSLEKGYLPTFRVDDPHFPLSLDQGFSPNNLKRDLDVIFPVLHGPFGEDGTVQGLFELANIPYVGPGHLSSAICMDKGIMKELLRGRGLPTPHFQTLHFAGPIDEQEILKSFSFPLFVKPAELGSSVGISKVKSKEDLLSAIKEGFKYGERVLIEEGIEGREIECSILGNLNPKASLPGEVIPTHEFYSYDAKYLDENGARFEVPAKLPPEKIEEIQELAIRAFKMLRCEGMARVDFFLKSDGTLLINELNTIPGFTTISLYPRLWEVSGLPFSLLIDELIQLAIERFNRCTLTGVKGELQHLSQIPCMDGHE